MMDLIFLIASETNDGEQGHRLIHEITSRGHPVIAIVNDFEKVPELHATFPTTVIFIVLDIKRNQNYLARTLGALPEPSYIIKFPGVELLEECFKTASYRVRERDRSELKFDRVAKDVDEEECRILITVVDKRSDVKKASGAVARNFTSFVATAKKKVRNSTVADNPPSSSERKPLLDNDEDEDEDPPPQQNFLVSLFSLCCPCLFAQFSPVMDYSFDNPPQLRAQMRTEQIAEMNEAFRKLHSDFQYSWGTTLNELRRTEANRLEELTQQVRAQKSEEEQQLNSRKEMQNQSRRDNLTGVLSENTLQRIEKSSSRQTKGKVNYEADKAFRQGKAVISNELGIERGRLRERHYNSIVEAQITKLKEIKTKYDRKTRSLHDQCFGQSNA